MTKSHSSTGKTYNDVVNNDIDCIHECSYLTPEQFSLDSDANCGIFSFLNANIRSLSNIFEKLQECIKTLSKDFTIIGLLETHLKVKPNDFYSLSGYNIEYMNRIGRESESYHSPTLSLTASWLSDLSLLYTMSPQIHGSLYKALRVLSLKVPRDLYDALKENSPKRTGLSG